MSQHNKSFSNNDITLQNFHNCDIMRLTLSADSVPFPYIATKRYRYF